LRMLSLIAQFNDFIRDRRISRLPRISSAS
jgi:hypothetical protein